MSIQDRILELRRVRASDLDAHPKNWRTHPPEQRVALENLLNNIGLANALVARELPDGRLQLIDGHLRAELADDTLVPVLIVDLDDEEASELLLTHDTITQLAGVHAENLADLMTDVQPCSPALTELFDKLKQQDALSTATLKPQAAVNTYVPQLWQVVVECDDEAQQRDVYEQCVASGYKCRLLML